MKEHTIFASVFLILVLGFLSFNAVGLTGQVFEEYQWRHLGERYSGAVTTGGVSARNLEGVSFVSNFGDNSYSSSWDESVDNIVLSKNAAMLGSEQRDYRVFGLANSAYAGLDIPDLRICIGHILKFTNQVAIENAEFYINQAGLQSKCLPAEQLDLNKDGFISRTDEKYARALAKGQNIDSLWMQYANDIPCNCASEGVSKYFSLTGGWRTCTNQEELGNNPYNTACFWVLTSEL